MTERFEIEAIIDDSRNTVAVLRYEAGTQPGDGPKFAATISAAADLIDQAIALLERSIPLIL